MGRSMCSVEDCQTPVHARGLCRTHCYRFDRYGSVMRPAVRKYRRHPPVLRESTDVERAYIAGYFDGEGCLTLNLPHHSSRWCVRVDFAQTQPAGVRFMESIYGGSIRIEKGRRGWRNKFCYRLTQWWSVRKFLLDIVPYVREKRDQVEAVLARFFIEQPDDADLRRLHEELSRMKRVEHG